MNRYGLILRHPAHDPQEARRTESALLLWAHYPGPGPGCSDSVRSLQLESLGLPEGPESPHVFPRSVAATSRAGAGANEGGAQAHKRACWRARASACAVGRTACARPPAGSRMRARGRARGRAGALARTRAGGARARAPTRSRGLSRAEIRQMKLPADADSSTSYRELSTPKASSRAMA